MLPEAVLFGNRGGQMADRRGSRALHVSLDEGKLSVIVLSLFSSWMLAFLFEGQILYALLDAFGVSQALWSLAELPPISPGCFYAAS